MCNSTDTKWTHTPARQNPDEPAEPDWSLPSGNYGDNDMEKFQFSPVQHMILERSPVPFGIYQYINQKIAMLLVSDGFLDLFHVEREGLAEQMEENVHVFTHPGDVAKVSGAIRRFATEGGEYDVVYRTKAPHEEDYTIIHALGKHVPTPDGGQLAVIWYANEGVIKTGPETEDTEVSLTVLNNTMQDILSADYVMRRYLYDDVTGLANMSHFIHMAGLSHRNYPADDPAVVFFDLTGMKRYNERYGYVQGDALLRSFAEILQEEFGADNCGRISGDHFAVYMHDASDIDTVMNRIFDRAGMLNEGRSLPVRAGIYRFAYGDTDMTSACDRAKIACDQERSSYHSAYTFFDETFLQKLEQQSYVLENFEHALNEGWIQVYYQPVVRAVTGEVCDEEALSRWVDPVRGVMKPSEFVPYLEDAKVLYKLDLFVIETALAEIRERKAAGLFIVPISVNLSWSDFTRCDMVTEISERMARYGVPRHMLNVEITESVVGRHPEYMRLQVERFHKAGINVWMDDFGSGYSSLEFLQSFDFDLIKFDTEFIRDLYTGKKSRIIMTQLIQMALKIGIDTIAEGVETPEQESFLREIGVDKIQGFYYSNPVPLTEILRRYANDEGIGFENVDAAHYYSAISKTNLSDPGVTNDVNSSDSYYNAVPMGIIELDGDTAYAVRFNQSFQNVMSRLKDMPIDLNGKKNMRVEIELDEVFKEAAVRCVETGEWEYIRDCVLRGLTINAFLRKIAVNPVTGAAAVLVIMISVL